MRLSIKPTVYRDRQGFLIYGRGQGVFGVRVFVDGTDRKRAEQVKANIIARKQNVFDIDNQGG